MTTNQLYLFNGLYLIILIVVAVLTRATGRRIAGALAGGQSLVWWHLVSALLVRTCGERIYVSGLSQAAF